MQEGEHFLLGGSAISGPSMFAGSTLLVIQSGTGVYGVAAAPSVGGSVASLNLDGRP